jgi:hypothetical protein
MEHGDPAKIIEKTGLMKEWHPFDEVRKVEKPALAIPIDGVVSLERPM